MSKLVSNSRWFVIRTNPRCEERARRSLSRSGFGVYLPVRKIERQHRRSKQWNTTAHPLMPGYLFLDMAGSFDWFSLRRCDGVAAVLGAADARGETVPFPVPAHLVERVMAAQLNLAFDDTREAKAKRGEDAKSIYAPGAEILVTKGPFVSFPAIVEQVRSNGTVEALISLFGRLTVMELAPDQLELAA